MNTIISLFLSWGLLITPVPKYNAQITEIENDRAVVEVIVDKGYRADEYLFNFPTKENSYEAHIPNPYIGKMLNPISTYGTFQSSWQGINYLGETETLYQFKSYDDSLWWSLTEADLGFIPEYGRSYALLYDENVDTKENHKCDPALDCDCYAYDDLFLGVYPLN